jgi:hypothetical protein
VVLKARRESRRGRWVRRWEDIVGGFVVGELGCKLFGESGTVKCEILVWCVRVSRKLEGERSSKAFIMASRAAACGANRNVKWQRKSIFVESALSEEDGFRNMFRYIFELL